MTKRMTDEEFARYTETISGPNVATHLQISNRGQTACGEGTPGRRQTKVIDLVTCEACRAIATGAEG
jgi:hypothetical protein